MSGELDLLERDVAQVRHRVKEDLANLRGPATTNLKRDLTDSAENIFTDIKDRLTDNPVAVVAIGAGLAWRFVHRPPVASLLVGYGLYSLMHSGRRAHSPMSASARQGGGAGEAIADRATQLAGDVKSAAANRLRGAGETFAQTAEAIKSTTSELTDRAAQAASDASDALVRGGAAVRERAPQVVQAAQDAAQRDKDAYLLGFAAAALTAAIGISARRRIH